MPTPNPTTSVQSQTTPTPTNPSVTPTKIPNVVVNYPVTPPSDIRDIAVYKRSFRKLGGKTACEMFTNEMANKVFNQPSRALREGEEYTISEVSDEFAGRGRTDVRAYRTTSDDKYIYFNVFETTSEENYFYVLEIYRKQLE